jgi:pyroglutamyl-peptidase
MTRDGLPLLITGFGPFRSFTVNPSGLAAAAAAHAVNTQAGRTLAVAATLTVDHLTARDELHALLREHRPRACLCTGLAAGDIYRLERLARRPVEFGPGDDAIVPEPLPSRWEWEPVSEALTARNAPWRFSDDCGRYVCESTQYAALHFAHHNGFPASACFLHVPAITEAFPLDRITADVTAVVRAVLGLA